MWNNSYTTTTECWQKTSDFPKGKKLPTYLGKAKEKRKNRNKRIGTGLAPLGGRCEGGKFPHTRTPLRGQRLRVAEGGASEPRRRAQQQGCGGQSGEIPAQGMPADQHSPAWDACSPTGAGGSWEVRLWLRRSDPRERTGVGCVNTAWRGLAGHS